MEALLAAKKLGADAAFSKPISEKQVVEALKRLAVRHLPPTPANFQSCYNEIAGLPDIPPFPDRPLRQLADGLVPRNEGQKKEVDALLQAITRRSWRQ